MPACFARLRPLAFDLLDMTRIIWRFGSVVAVASMRAWRFDPSPEIRTVALVGFESAIMLEWERY